MKFTVLDMVQNILSEMGSDEVNSLSDTLEAIQVAQIIEDTYYNIMSERFWPMEAIRTTLDPLSDTDKPTHFQIPDRIDNILSLRYDTRENAGDRKRYTVMNYVEPEEFFNNVLALDSTASNVQVVTDHTGTELFIRNDLAPSFWTSFDDEYVVFNSFDSNIDTTLQSSKLLCYAEKVIDFSQTDLHVPDNLPDKLFPYLLAEAKSQCFVSLNGAVNPKVEQTVKRLRSRLMRDKLVSKREPQKYPDYGRT